MRRRLDSGETTAPELARAHLDRIRALDSQVNAFITVCEDEAMERAEAAQARIESGEAGALTGIPIALKDNIITRGIRTTCASRILENYVPPYSATVAERLDGAGAVLLGKTNLDEFAMGTSTEFSAFFPTKNPWDLGRVPGGSSGGSAAAVAAGMVPIALGSDTGGSIRQPASLCGVIGFKPTYGRVSRYGLVAFSSSLDQIGPFARCVEDATLLFEAIHGVDPRDATTVDAPYDPALARAGDLKGTRVGCPVEMFSEAVDSDVRQIVLEARERLAEAEAIVEEFSAPMIEHGVSTYYIIAPAEASSNLARYDGVRYGLRIAGDTPIEMMSATRAKGFGKEVIERVLIGTYVLSSGYYDAFYATAHRARTLMRDEMRRAFQKYDLVLAPTSPTVAFRIGEKAGDPLALKLADFCTI
ncbi:MAG: Asp-tRNA(Asn)/Glu-tRNA(Gln) amidotransferase GatCAB subunit A, partial [Armatimonadota bacterium]